VLAEPDTFIAPRFAASPAFTVFLHGSVSIWAFIMVIVNISILRRIFLRVGVVRICFCHWRSFRRRWAKHLPIERLYQVRQRSS